jgi:hypothetical protein
MRSEAARAFWVLLGIRVAFWVGAALTLLWQPLPPGKHARDLTLPVFQAYDSHTDLLFNTFTQWDAGWYLNIAENGYRGEQAAAFFPLYPLTVRAVAVVTRSPVVAGVLVSLIAAGAAAVLLARLARPLLGDQGARDTVLYLALYPVAFVFTAVYSDGLFLALALASFYAALRGRSLAAGVLGALAVATRLIGLALVPPLVVLLWRRGDLRRSLVRLAPLVLIPLPIVLFAWHLEGAIGDWRAFYRAQSAYWLRHTPTLGPIGGLWDAFSQAGHGALQVLLHLRRGIDVTHADEIGSRNALHFLLLVAVLALTWVAWRRLGPAYGLYSLGYIAVVLASPVSYFPLVSLPRFVIGDFPLFLALTSLTDGRPRAREAVLVSFAAVGAVAAVGFSRHAWVA